MSIIKLPHVDMQSPHKKSKYKESNFLVSLKLRIFNVICFLSAVVKCIHQHSFRVKFLARGIVKLRFLFGCIHIVAAIFFSSSFFLKQLPNNTEKKCPTGNNSVYKLTQISAHCILFNFAVFFRQLSVSFALALAICLFDRRRTKNRAMYLSVHFVCCARPFNVVAYLSEFS